MNKMPLSNKFSRHQAIPDRTTKHLGCCSNFLAFGFYHNAWSVVVFFWGQPGIKRAIQTKRPRDRRAFLPGQPSQTACPRRRDDCADGACPCILRFRQQREHPSRGILSKKTSAILYSNPVTSQNMTFTWRVKKYVAASPACDDDGLRLVLLHRYPRLSDTSWCYDIALCVLFKAHICINIIIFCAPSVVVVALRRLLGAAPLACTTQVAKSVSTLASRKGVSEVLMVLKHALFKAVTVTAVGEDPDECNQVSNKAVTPGIAPESAGICRELRSHPIPSTTHPGTVLSNVLGVHSPLNCIYNVAEGSETVSAHLTLQACKYINQVTADAYA